MLKVAPVSSSVGRGTPVANLPQDPPKPSVQSSLKYLARIEGSFCCHGSELTICAWALDFRNLTRETSNALTSKPLGQYLAHSTTVPLRVSYDGNSSFMERHAPHETYSTYPWTIFAGNYKDLE